MATINRNKLKQEYPPDIWKHSFVKTKDRISYETLLKATGHKTSEIEITHFDVQNNEAIVIWRKSLLFEIGEKVAFENQTFYIANIEDDLLLLQKANLEIEDIMPEDCIIHLQSRSFKKNMVRANKNDVVRIP